MSDFNYRVFLECLAIAFVLIGTLSILLLSAGCVTMAKEQIKEAMKTPTPTPTPIPTPTPTPTPTPIPTPKAIPTLAAHPVDPYMHGERWQGQWFKWLRLDVQGEKDLDAGIIVYRSEFADKLTYYNNLWGNYYAVKPSEGNRYFIVWIHEEIFGTNGTFDPSMWIFDENAFRLQVKGTMQENIWPVVPEYVIGELQNEHDYYNTVISAPFGYDRIYTAHNPETGGWVAQKRGWLRMGQGNSIDGYLIYEVPEKTMPGDLLLLGNFATFGTAYWRFSR